jgi:hypothetical protein
MSTSPLFYKVRYREHIRLYVATVSSYLRGVSLYMSTSPLFYTVRYREHIRLYVATVSSYLRGVSLYTGTVCPLHHSFRQKAHQTLRSNSIKLPKGSIPVYRYILLTTLLYRKYMRLYVATVSSYLRGVSLYTGMSTSPLFYTVQRVYETLYVATVSSYLRGVSLYMSTSPLFYT